MGVGGGGGVVVFLFNDTATTEIYTLSLHDALPICRHENRSIKRAGELPQQEMGRIKSGALPQREIGILKSEGVAATGERHFKKRGRCRNEK